MTVVSSLSDGVLDIVIDSPPVNAVSVGDLADLSATLQSVVTRPDVRVVVLRSEGKGFCAGGDLKEVQSLPGFEGLLGQASGSQAASLAIADCPVPVIACIHGYCIGVGVLLLGTSDIVVAAAGSVVILAEADNGATAGAVQSLGLFSEKALRTAMFTCAPVPVESLKAYGSVAFVEPDQAAAVARARELAAGIAAKNPAVIRRLKKSINASARRDLETLYRQELSYTYELNMLGDAREARADFIESRRPSYLADPTTPHLPHERTESAGDSHGQG